MPLSITTSDEDITESRTAAGGFGGGKCAMSSSQATGSMSQDIRPPANSAQDQVTFNNKTNSKEHGVCFQCNHPTHGDDVMVNGSRVHKHCFICSFCRNELMGDFHIQNGQLFCKTCNNGMHPHHTNSLVPPSVHPQPSDQHLHTHQQHHQQQQHNTDSSSMIGSSPYPTIGGSTHIKQPHFHPQVGNVATEVIGTTASYGQPPPPPSASSKHFLYAPPPTIGVGSSSDRSTDMLMGMNHRAMTSHHDDVFESPPASDRRLECRSIYGNSDQQPPASAAIPENLLPHQHATHRPSEPSTQGFPRSTPSSELETITTAANSSSSRTPASTNNKQESTPEAPRPIESNKRPRTRLKSNQKHTLLNFFEKNPKPSKREREQLATSTGLPVRVVQVWFQNTRAARKKPNNKGNPAGLAFQQREYGQGGGACGYGPVQLQRMISNYHGAPPGNAMTNPGAHYQMNQGASGLSAWEQQVGHQQMMDGYGYQHQAANYQNQHPQYNGQAGYPTAGQMNHQMFLNGHNSVYGGANPQVAHNGMAAYSYSYNYNQSGQAHHYPSNAQQGGPHMAVFNGPSPVGSSAFQQQGFVGQGYDVGMQHPNTECLDLPTKEVTEGTPDSGFLSCVGDHPPAQHPTLPTTSRVLAGHGGGMHGGGAEINQPAHHVTAGQHQNYPPHQHAMTSSSDHREHTLSFQLKIGGRTFFEW